MMINVERYGSGSPLVFIHGAGGTTKVWNFQQGQLSGLFEVILIDLPGHGTSPGDGCGTIEEYGHVVSEATDQLGLEKFFVIGHSMGGAIAMHLALERPSSLAGLVLIGTGARLKVFPAILEGILKDKETTCRQIIDYAFSPMAPAAMKEAAYQEYVKSHAEVVHRDFTACDRFDIRESAHSINIPTLIMCGAHDTLTPPKYAEYLHERIAGSSLRLIEDASHMVMLEKPREVSEAIAEFVSAATSHAR
jgi:pimeloyl-ACP methyl ester carboxylesterase